LLSLFLLRAALVAAPFVVWFLWQAWRRRSGREPRPTPWPWLIAAAGLLLGASLMATAIFRTDNRGQTYVPGEVTTDGRVSEGRYEAK